MSKVTEAIDYWLFEKREPHFVLPLSLFTDEDGILLDSGAFRRCPYAPQSVECPFDCGRREFVETIERENGENTFFIVCQNGYGTKKLEPREYEQVEFVPEVYFRNWPALAEKLGVADAGKKEEGKKRIKRRPRCTEWMKIERQAVIDYANNPKTNPQGKKESALVPIVWRKNKVEFEAVVKLPKGECGYKDMHTLQAYFFRKEATEKRRKTVVTYPNSGS